ncbi:Oidioi.mRNA.OKI2018_I69.chr1.g1603.t1.cds [Oikopleura dioica]|uniref:Oidioi.mRNA.OKI2018_I69.chr1.g1603.t1.cds n=1 Tax=Oikopleura dioica TaxID=34765 RepID=A0ABN7SXL6_OIKDI|nr:Oidioi.mRNA.OKI2018_I69.chr1.g1603.t1.cds [Oikopleura dioica]
MKLLLAIVAAASANALVGESSVFADEKAPCFCCTFSITCCAACECIKHCTKEEFAFVQGQKSIGLAYWQTQYPDHDVYNCVSCAKCLKDGEECDVCEVGTKCPAEVYKGLPEFL